MKAKTKTKAISITAALLLSFVAAFVWDRTSPFLPAWLTFGPKIEIQVYEFASAEKFSFESEIILQDCGGFGEAFECGPPRTEKIVGERGGAVTRVDIGIRNNGWLSTGELTIFFAAWGRTPDLEWVELIATHDKTAELHSKAEIILENKLHERTPHIVIAPLLPSQALELSLSSDDGVSVSRIQDNNRVLMFSRASKEANEK